MIQIIKPAEVTPKPLHGEWPMPRMRIIIALCKSSHDELIGSLHERCVPVIELLAWFKVVCLFVCLFYSYTEEGLNTLVGVLSLDLYRLCSTKYKCMCLYLKIRQNIL